MNLTIIADDGIVAVDGVFRTVNLTTLDANIHAVQWNGTTGHIEYKDDSFNLDITDVTAYQTFIDAWTSAVEPPLTLNDNKTVKTAEFMDECLIRIVAQVSDWDSMEAIKTIAGIWDTHLATNATVAQTLAKDIYIYVRDTVPPKITAITTQVALDAIDPIVADPFGDGTPWPI